MQNSEQSVIDWRSHCYFLGECYIVPVNQIGERVRFNKKTGGFTLNRRGNVFKVFVHLCDTDEPLPDFREAEVLHVLLETGDMLVSFDSLSRKVSTIQVPHGQEIPSNALFQYAKRKFDGSSVSLSPVNAPYLWMRHCNSVLQVTCVFEIFILF